MQIGLIQRHSVYLARKDQLFLFGTPPVHCYSTILTHISTSMCNIYLKHMIAYSAHGIWNRMTLYFFPHPNFSHPPLPASGARFSTSARAFWRRVKMKMKVRDFPWDQMCPLCILGDPRRHLSQWENDFCRGTVTEREMSLSRCLCFGKKFILGPSWWKLPNKGFDTFPVFRFNFGEIH